MSNSKSKEMFIENPEKIRCPICNESPHEAILLLCDSHPSCRPYVCGTGPHYSHCFGRIIGSCNDNKNLYCPVCYKKVRDLSLNPPAGHFMNLMQRKCARRTCQFKGSYRELVNHMKAVHPSDSESSGSANSELMNQDLWNLEAFVKKLNL